MMVEPAPAAALVVPKPEFLLELLVVAFDAPPELGEFDQARETNVLRQGREPVLGGLLPYHGSVWWRAGSACDSRLRDERSALNGWDRATGRDRRDGHGATPAGPA